MIYFTIAIIFFIVGRYAFPRSSRVVVKDSSMPGHRTAQPPPPMPKATVKPGHLKPLYHAYKIGLFNSVNACTSCGLIGLREDLHLVDPCRNCGGKVKRGGAAKWDNVDGIWQWVFSQAHG